MKHRIRRLALFGAVMASTGCDRSPLGPSQTVTGSWHFTAAKFRVYEMSLTQTGTRISGEACVYVIGVPGTVPVRTAAVNGEYPRLQFDDPFVPGCRYDMKFEEDRDQIAGDCGTRSLVRFNRGGSGQCRGAAVVASGL